MKCFFCNNPKSVWEESRVKFYGKPLSLCASCYKYFILGKPKDKELLFTCQDCNKTFFIDFSKNWANLCYPCWKKRKEIGNVPLIVIKEKLKEIKEEKQKKAKIIAYYRSLIENDKESITKKLNFLQKLECIVPETKDVVSFEMYPEEINGSTIKSKKCVCPQYEHEVEYHNTRLKIKSETRAEIDNLPFDDAVKIIEEICEALKIKGYSFYVFYAYGGRSPHIVIYDFEELNDYDGFMREQIQKSFWRDISPLWTYLDRAVWEDDHFVPLEYAPHWKYKTPFNLIYKYNAEEKCKN